MSSSVGREGFLIRNRQNQFMSLDRRRSGQLYLPSRKLEFYGLNKGDEASIINSDKCRNLAKETQNTSITKPQVTETQPVYNQQ